MTSLSDLYAVYLKHPQICTDTRQLTPGALFFALKGPSFNGNRFSQQALEQGAAYAVVDEPEALVNDRCLLVPDVLTTLQQLALHHRRQLSIPFLAITGSNGKTTTKELVRAVLSRKYKTLATRGNLNNHIGVPLTILSIDASTEFAVIEMGANHQGEIASYCSYTEPDFGLITNVGKAHLEGFGGFEGVKKGKGELYAFLARNHRGIFLNGDNVHLTGMADHAAANSRFTYGTTSGCDVIGELVKEQPFLEVSWTCGDTSGHISTHLVGVYNFENILSAVAVGCRFGVPPADIDAAIAAYSPDNSRSQVIQRGTNTIVLDAYNANPTSMEAALRNFSGMHAEMKWVCIGDMAELGEASEQEHARMIQLITQLGFSHVVLVGKNFGRFAGQLDCHHFDDSEKAAVWLKQQAPQQTHLLIKGSRSTKMEKLLDALPA